MMSWPGFAADQDAAHRARRRRSHGAARRAIFLAGGRSARSGRWPSRVWMTSSPAARARREQPAVRLDRAAQLRHVIAEHFAEAARLEEIALHVDDQQRAMRRRERELVRFGGKIDGRSHLVGPLRGPPLGPSLLTQGTCLSRDGRRRATSGFGLPTASIRAPLFFAAAQGPGDLSREVNLPL